MIVPTDGLTHSEAIREWWSRCAVAGDGVGSTADPVVAGGLLAAMVSDGVVTLPQPGTGATAARFDALTALGELDLTVGRLLEAHADARAILSELDADAVVSDHSVWAVWAAEPPAPKVTASCDADGVWRLSGRKPWCSGAGIVTNALVSAQARDGSRLFAVDLAAPEVVPVDDSWPSPALFGTDTRSVDFHDAPARPIGGVDDYVARPGFWYGAIGVAAVWFGGACAIGRRLETTAAKRDLGDLGAAHLGAVTAALAAGRAVLREAAAYIDDGTAVKPPQGEILARSVRAVVEDSAARVIDHVGRALGPGPLAMDGEHARRVTDLQLYLRQSHAEGDLAELGRRVAEAGTRS